VRKPPLTALGKAIRQRDAYLLEHDYGGAIKAACSGDVTRLLNLLRAHRRPVSADTLSNDDLDRLADLIEATAKHGHRPRDTSVHLAAKLAETIMTMISGRVRDGARTAAIDVACKQVQRETGQAVDAERVRDLLRRPRGRRR
jgi:hypothetical protein